MGRGRAKAKQTKVARQLKYNTPDMDLDSLQRELAQKYPSSNKSHSDSYVDDYEDVADKYADYGDWEEK